MTPSRVALITGGQGELARAIAEKLEQSGWKIHAPGRDQLDVTSRDSVTAFFEENLDSLDLLINNAGTTRDGLFLKMAEAEWDAVIDTNLKGAFLCSQAAVKRMVKRRNGQIMNIGSFSAIQPPPGQANYAAAKAGLIGLTRSLAREVGKRNVSVNTILPGFLETKMTRNLSEEAIHRALEMHALGRFTTCEEVARFVDFLSSTENISGQVFQLDSR